MIKQIKNLTKLQMKNLYGVNVFCFTKDKKEKTRKISLAIVYIFLIIMACGYIGMTTFGYISIGLAKIVPAYLIMLSSILILFFQYLRQEALFFKKMHMTYYVLFQYLKQLLWLAVLFVCMWKIFY